MAVAVESEVSERALEVHKRALVVDIAGVNALPYELQRQGGVSVSAVSVSNHDQMGTENSLQSIARYLNYTHRYPNDLMVITSVDDIYRAKQENKVGLMFHFQGIPPIPGIYWIEMFIRIGVKAMALTYNQQNAYGCGAGERVDTGTTYLGRQVIRDMNRLGALIDLSHLGPVTAMEVVDTSTKPVVLSHSNCYSLAPHPRNARDELIKAVAESGGFVGISVYAPLSDENSGRFPTIEDVLNHIDYAVKLVGIDHVALGSDSSGGDDMGWWLYQERHREAIPAYTFNEPWYGKRLYHSVLGFPNMSALPKITEGMLRRGYSEEDIHKFMGGNAIRVLKQVW